MRSSYSNKGVLLNVVYVLLVAVIAGALIAWVATSLASDEGPDMVASQEGATPSTETGPNMPIESLVGTWSAENNGSEFVATVTDTGIQIKFVADDTSMIYWNGTFQSAQDEGAEVMSKKVELDKIVMSRATEKRFVYEGGQLKFEFEALGITKVVKMSRV